MTARLASAPTVASIRVDLRGRSGTVYLRAAGATKFEKVGSSADAKWIAFETAEREGVEEITYRQTITRVMWTIARGPEGWRKTTERSVAY